MSMRDLIGRLFRRPTETERRPGEDIFRSMVEQSADMICHVEEGRFTYVSPSVRDLFDIDPAGMIGTDGLHLIHEADQPLLAEALRRIATGELGTIRHEFRIVSGERPPKWAELNAYSEVGETGRTRTMLVVRDISHRKRIEEELAALAMKDGLTGLANRRAFDETLERSWRQTLRQGGEMALLLLDIDHFKQFNDAYGHQAGDDCLRTVATVLNQFARRPGDLACRYGGEEFALVIGQIEPAAAAALGEEIRRAVEALGLPHEGRPGGGHVTISVGAATAVARIGGSIRMPESLLQAADHALYKAKAGGRNRVERSVLIAPTDQQGNGPPE